MRNDKRFHGTLTTCGDKQEWWNHLPLSIQVSIDNNMTKLKHSNFRQRISLNAVPSTTLQLIHWFSILANAYSGAKDKYTATIITP